MLRQLHVYIGKKFLFILSITLETVQIQSHTFFFLDFRNPPICNVTIFQL